MTAIAPNPHAIQEGAVTFNFPVASDEAESVGGLLNYILSIAVPVGSIIDSLLTPDQLQAELGSPFPYTWVLANGSTTVQFTGQPLYVVAASQYAAVTGHTALPDARGVFRRGKNNGRADGKQNPDGELALGQYTADKFASHTHTYAETFPQSQSNVGEGTDQGPAFERGPTPTSATGSNENAPKNRTVNAYIRIN